MNFSEVEQESRKYFNNDKLAATVWMQKYALKDKDGNFIEKTPDDMHKRMASVIAKKIKQNGYAKFADELKIYNSLKDFKKTIPGGSVMSQLGNPESIGSLSNCTVVPQPFDSYGGILFLDEQLAQLMKRRCGVGTDLSTLRPVNTSVSNAAGQSTGLVSFASRFSNTTREVAQDGRRGALMLTIHVEHPDTEEFVRMKTDLTKITGANISLQLSEEFMQAVEQKQEFIQRFPVETEITEEIKQRLNDEPLNELVNIGSESFKKIDASKLWDIIVLTAHTTAEPGIMFNHRHHFYSTSSLYKMFENVSTNPCGEIMMGPYDSCRLVAQNMFSYVGNPYTKDAYFKYDEWSADIKTALLINDTIVDLELDGIKRILKKLKSDPEPQEVKQREIKLWENFYKIGKAGRRTGLGFTGLADAVAAMGFDYGSDESLNLIDLVMDAKMVAEFKMSIELAKINGPFEGFDPKIEMQSDFIKMMDKKHHALVKEMMKYGRRNVSISTVAPTGTTSMMTQTASGIEPVFSLSYKRRKKINPTSNATPDFIDKNGDKWEEYKVYHEKLHDYAKANNVSLEEAETQSAYANSSADSIHWSSRVKLQGIIQDYTTHSISSTINLPKDTSIKTVDEIYMESWKRGLKGITVYREGSRDGVLITDDSDKPKVAENVKIIHHAPKRLKDLKGYVYSFFNKGEKWIGIIGVLGEEPYELFTGLAESFKIPGSVKEGIIRKTKVTDEEGVKHSKYDFIYEDGHNRIQTAENLNRSFRKEYDDFAKLISGFMRHGMPLHSLDSLLGKIHFDGEFLGSWKAGVRRIIQKFIKQEEINRGEGGGKLCPNCGDPDGLVFEDGCKHCVSCGFSACG